MLWRKVQAAPRDPEGFFFRAEWRTNVMDKFGRARDAAGLPQTFVPHHLRHMYASALLADGVPITDVAKYLGHASIAITFETYGHLVQAAGDRARVVFENRWSAEKACAHEGPALFCRSCWVIVYPGFEISLTKAEFPPGLVRPDAPGPPVVPQPASGHPQIGRLVEVQEPIRSTRPHDQTPNGKSRRSIG